MRHHRKIFGVLLVLGYIPLLAAVVFFVSTGYAGQILAGPALVQSVTSPDGKYLAYVVERPSIDPPNQALCVERADGIHYMHIADLAEDVDSIREVVWSPDSRMVVFHSHHYLTATRVSDWRTVRVYLGKEWRRTKPDRRSTFTSGGVRYQVQALEFPEPDTFAYRIEGDQTLHEVHLGSADQF